jgi:hypothetical protein
MVSLVRIRVKSILWIIRFALFELAFSFSYSFMPGRLTQGPHWHCTPNPSGESHDGSSSKAWRRPEFKNLRLLGPGFHHLDRSYWLDQLNVFMWGFFGLLYMLVWFLPILVGFEVRMP